MNTMYVYEHVFTSNAAFEFVENKCWYRMYHIKVNRHLRSFNVIPVVENFREDYLLNVTWYFIAQCLWRWTCKQCTYTIQKSKTSVFVDANMYTHTFKDSFSSFAARICSVREVMRRSSSAFCSCWQKHNTSDNESIWSSVILANAIRLGIISLQDFFFFCISTILIKINVF